MSTVNTWTVREGKKVLLSWSCGTVDDILKKKRREKDSMLVMIGRVTAGYTED